MQCIQNRHSQERQVFGVFLAMSVRQIDRSRSSVNHCLSKDRQPRSKGVFVQVSGTCRPAFHDVQSDYRNSSPHIFHGDIFSQPPSFLYNYDLIPDQFLINNR